MGYTTDYSGIIDLSSETISDKLNKFIEGTDSKDWEEYFEVEGISLEDKRFEIGGYGKLYDDELQIFCLFVAKIDRGAVGEISCNGEDREDIWKIIIKDGKVIIQNGFVSYNDKDQKEFENKKVNKDIYKITKDKELLKEIIIEELEDGK